MRAGWKTASAAALACAIGGFALGHVAAQGRMPPRERQALSITALPTATALMPPGPIPITERRPLTADTVPRLAFDEPPADDVENELEWGLHWRRPVSTAVGIRPTPVPVAEPAASEFIDAEPGALPESGEAAPLPTGDAQQILDRLLEVELADVPVNERSVWREALRDLSPQDAIGIIGMWRSLGKGPFQRGSDDPADASSPLVARDAAVPGDLAPAVLDGNAPSALHALNSQNIATHGYRRREWIGAAAGADCVRISPMQGVLDSTENSFDIAIDGRGYLQVEHEGSTRLTRCGRLTRRADGRLCAWCAEEILPLLPAVEIPSQCEGIVIQEDGDLFGQTNGKLSDTAFGRIGLALVLDDSRLRPVSTLLFEPTAESGPAWVGPPGSGRGSLVQHCLERSNVEPNAGRQELRLGARNAP